MRALVKATPGPGLEMVERPIPAIGPDEVLIRVMRTGICGTDLHIHRWDDWAQRELHTPLIPGHEFSGDVVEIGANVHDIAVGDLVSGEGHIVCGTCRNCRAGRRQMCIRTIGLGLHRDGAFAEFVALPASNVWVHQFAVDPDLAAIFDPLGNAVHTALAFPLVGEDVLVTGCGPIGLMSVALARFVGARHVVATDVSEPRLLRARELGADDTVDVSSHSIHEAQERLGMREGFDVGFEMSGAATALSEMIDNMNHGGRIAILGLPTDVFPIDWAKVVTHMLTISGIYGRQMFETWNAMGAMLETSAKLRADIGSIITDRFPRDAWAEAFAVAGSSTTGKVIIDWTE